MAALGVVALLAGIILIYMAIQDVTIGELARSVTAG